MTPFVFSNMKNDTAEDYVDFEAFATHLIQSSGTPGVDEGTKLNELWGAE